ncbi:short-chain dehydrogenase/oxidoreductase [Zopfia rhizophila CBS 207.26]|uniref:Short-chain dehydrogenase/oxidoreductase n=1 Tax=Zopfia rhizophila CBS 207.26 TaxID=1314779 RepID=A0A6A6EDS1_9PEZI|nr:short-chain dehydrogenase/oxidoreductase [Zopfia rhizophila CBS 207.26]
MAFPYKHVCLVGATSGIGRAMADRLIAEGVKVTAVGRRQDRLNEFVKEHGKTKASSLAFDISDLDQIPKFAEEVMKAHSDIDCIFLNAGIQHRYDFSSPSSLNLPRFMAEMTTNFNSFVAFTHAFLPYLLNQSTNTGIIYTGTHLGIVPASTMPAYSASKAALDSFILCVREQLRDTRVKITNLSPPPVQTELHDAEMGQEAGRAIGMPVTAFADAAYKELTGGNENIIIGSVAASSMEQFMEIVNLRREAFDRLAMLLRGMK